MTGITLELDLIQTIAVAAMVLFAGDGIRRRIGTLERYNIPSAVIGGLLFALAALALRQSGAVSLQFDTLLQGPLMTAFFTTIGFGASVSLLRAGGPVVVVFFLASATVAAVQNVLGVAIATPLGEHPLLGALAGSVALTGGPATALAFAPEFERAGVPAAGTAAIAAAMVGIVSGSLLGGPVATRLIARLRGGAGGTSQTTARARGHGETVPAASPAAPHEDAEAWRLLKHITLIVVAMSLGTLLNVWLTRVVTLPANIGAMIVAAAMRNLDDLTGWLGISPRTIDDLGTIALSLFLAMALMTLHLWQLAGLAVPLAVILGAQVALVAAIALAIIPRIVGRDYEAAVMACGFCGFMLGTVANAMANMEAVTARHGPAPKAFLVVPMVGAFFVDFANALIITAFLNLWR